MWIQWEGVSTTVVRAGGGYPLLRVRSRFAWCVSKLTEKLNWRTIPAGKMNAFCSMFAWLLRSMRVSYCSSAMQGVDMKWLLGFFLLVVAPNAISSDFVDKLKADAVAGNAESQAMLAQAYLFG